MDVYAIQAIVSSLWQVSMYIVSFTTLLLAFYFVVVFLFDRKKEKLKKLKSWPKVSIIIPCYNEEDNIIETLESLEKIDYPRNKLEILVVDDGSKDKTVELAKEYAKDKKHVRVFKKRHGGKADTVNYGIKKSTGDLIMVLDADTELSRNALKKMVRMLMSDEATMAVIPSLIPKRVRNIWEIWQDIEYRIMNFSRMLLMAKNALNITPAATLYKKRFFEKHGLFDVNNITEDYEMGLRIISKGYRVRFCPVKVLTKVPDSFEKLKRQRIRWTFGHLKTSLKYKNLFFTKKFQDLGNFYMPIIFFSTVFLGWFFLISFINWIVNTYIWYNEMRLIGFDLSYFMSFSFEFNPDYFILRMLDINYALFNVSLVLAAITLWFIKKLGWLNRKHLPGIVSFYLVYIWPLLYFYAATIVKIVTKRKVGW